MGALSAGEYEWRAIADCNLVGTASYAAHTSLLEGSQQTLLAPRLAHHFFYLHLPSPTGRTLHTLLNGLLQVRAAVCASSLTLRTPHIHSVCTNVQRIRVFEAFTVYTNASRSHSSAGRKLSVSSRSSWIRWRT